MEVAAAARQQAVVGDVLRQRVLEDEGRLVARRALVEELEPAQLIEVCADVRAPFHTRVSSLSGTSRPRTDAVCSSCFAIVRQPIDARHDDAVNRVGNRLGRPAPCSRTVRASSSRKNGLPSPCATGWRSDTSAGSGRLSARPTSISRALSAARERRQRDLRQRTSDRSQGAAIAGTVGRHDQQRGPPRRRSTSVARNSSDVRSIQWMSSTTMTSGRRAPPSGTACAARRTCGL